jgi:hypothetical protein
MCKQQLTMNDKSPVRMLQYKNFTSQARKEKRHQTITEKKICIFFDSPITIEYKLRPNSRTKRTPHTQRAS